MRAEGAALRAIGHLRSPYPEKFGVPRQPGLVEAAEGLLVPTAEFSSPEAWRGIEGFSHVWLLFGFHLDAGRGGPDRLTVRPPRLGGEERVGVFASRSGFRPNGIGLSALRLLEVTEEEGATRLRLGGVDLVDGTPVYDVKPYLPWSDARAEARAGFALEAPRADRRVDFAAGMEEELRRRGLLDLVTQTLALDPRPAWQRGDEASFGTRFASVDVRWRVVDDVVTVLSLNEIEETSS